MKRDFELVFDYFFNPFALNLQVLAKGHYTPGHSGNDPDADNEITELTVRIKETNSDGEEVEVEEVALFNKREKRWESLYDILEVEVWDRVA